MLTERELYQVSQAIVFASQRTNIGSIIDVNSVLILLARFTEGDLKLVETSDGSIKFGNRK